MSGFTRRQLLLGAAAAAPLIALTPGLVIAGPPTRPLLRPAIAARTAFASYGMNCHFSFLSGSVWANTDAAAQWILTMGVGSVRQSLPRSAHGRDAVKRGMDQLGQAGVRWCCPVLVSDDAPTLDAARAAVNAALDWLQANTDLALLDSLPGLNEPNAEGRGLNDWVARTRWAAQALWEETRRRPAFNNVLIQGPPLHTKGGTTAIRQDASALGDLSHWIGRGYSGGAELVPEDVASLYAPKQFLVHLIGGRKFFSYKLLDDAPPYRDTDVATREAGFGVVATPTLDPLSWRRKPGFDAVRRLWLGLAAPLRR